MTSVCEVMVVAVSLTPGIAWAAPAKGGAFAKVGPELQTLYEAPQAGQQTGAAFVPADPSVPVVDGLVTIDAVASGGVNNLKKDLVALARSTRPSRVSRPPESPVRTGRDLNDTGCRRTGYALAVREHSAGRSAQPAARSTSR